MTALIAAIVVGLGTYASRSVFILALAKRRIPETVMISLQFVAPAVLGALIVALLTTSEGNVSIGVPEVGAFIGGGAVAYRTRSHILTLVVGMILFWLLRALVGAV